MKAVSAGRGPVTDKPAARSAAMAGLISLDFLPCPCAPTSPAWGFRPSTTMLRRCDTEAPSQAVVEDPGRGLHPLRG